MNYRLIVLTHGDAPHLDLAIHSFWKNVRPRPTQHWCVIDGPGRAPSIEPGGGWMMLGGGGQRGFCGASAEAWELSSTPGEIDYVFWLENDFVFQRTVDLNAMAVPLEADPMLAQVALLRNAVSSGERAAGGLIQSRPAENFEERGVGNIRWLEHTLWWTTNPSLFRRSLAASEPWPDVPGCEGHMTIRLREKGYRFGLWGSRADDPWVQHVGERTGFGY